MVPNLLCLVVRLVDGGLAGWEVGWLAVVAMVTARGRLGHTNCGSAAGAEGARPPKPRGGDTPFCPLTLWHLHLPAWGGGGLGQGSDPAPWVLTFSLRPSPFTQLPQS